MGVKKVMLRFSPDNMLFEFGLNDGADSSPRRACSSAE